MKIGRLTSCRNGACFSLELTTACLFNPESPQTLEKMDDGITENIIDNETDEFIARNTLRTNKTYTSICFDFGVPIATSFGVHRYLIGQSVIFPMMALPFSMCWSHKIFYSHEVFRQAHKSFTNDFPVSCYDKAGNLKYNMNEYGSPSIDNFFIYETIEDNYARAIIKMYADKEFEPLI